MSVLEDRDRERLLPEGNSPDHSLPSHSRPVVWEAEPSLRIYYLVLSQLVGVPSGYPLACGLGQKGQGVVNG